MCVALPSVGFIGLGIMGLPMVRHLCNAGYPVRVYNRTPSKMTPAESYGAYAMPSPRQVAERSDILITMLTGPAAVDAVMNGADGALASPKKGLVWLQMSTLDLASTLHFAELAESRSLSFVDCPVTGSKKQVEAAELILLAGGASEPLQYVRPLLERFGKTIIEAGPVGAGTALKLAVNLIVAQLTTALAESVQLAEASGVDPALLFKVLKAAPALNCGYFTVKEASLLQREFTPAFALENMSKDVRFMLAQAAAQGIDLPVTQAVGKLLERAEAEGLGEQDVSAVLLALHKAPKPNRE
jgi:3-hydroxyisobutyrate dehydrogenase